MDILDLFLKTPLAKRYAAGFIERGLILGLGAIAVWLNLGPEEYQTSVAKFAAEVAPAAAAAVMLLLARQRMKKAEMTIRVAHAADPMVPRAAIDQRVNTIMKADIPPAPKPTPDVQA